jgi:Ca2+-binding RTX toxin-like protein
LTPGIAMKILPVVANDAPAESREDSGMATYIGTAGNDSLYVGYDKLYGLDGNDTLGSDQAGLDMIEGGDGNDYIFLVSADALGDFYGGNGNDTAYGSQGTDHIDGGAGDDLLMGSLPDDYPANGEPPPRKPSGNDYFDGGWGTDGIYGYDGDDIIYGGDGDDSRTVISVPDYYGNTLSILAGLYGGDGNDYLDGGRGNDYLTGGNGADGLLGGFGNDVIFGDGGGTGGVDWIEGDDGNDYLYGQGDNDVIFGGTGNDSLVGGPGFDVLYGGLGGDNFFINSPADGYDYIGDFKPSDYDALVFTSANFGGITSATIASHFYAGAGFGGFAVTGPYFAFDTTNGNLWYNTPGAPTLVAQLPGASLTTSSMYFV